MDWPFDKAQNSITITTISVHKNKLPILNVSHYLADNSWAFTCGSTKGPNDSVLLTMEEIINKDSSLLEISDLPPGWSAIRKNVGGKWHRHQDNDLLKKAELLDFMEHGAINANVKTNLIKVFNFIERNVIDFKALGWCLFMLHICLNMKGNRFSQLTNNIGLIIGASLNLIAIVGLILFITKEELRNSAFISRFVPYIGCLLLWLVFICFFSYSFARSWL